MSEQAASLVLMSSTIGLPGGFCAAGDLFEELGEFVYCLNPFGSVQRGSPIIVSLGVFGVSRARNFLIYNYIAALAGLGCCKAN